MAKSAGEGGSFPAESEGESPSGKAGRGGGRDGWEQEGGWAWQEATPVGENTTKPYEKHTKMGDIPKKVYVFRGQVGNHYKI